MAVLARTSSWAEFVHTSDPECDPNGKPGPIEGWLLAAGQPAGATRFRVRPLGMAEVDEYEAAKEASGPDVAIKITLRACLAIDGDPIAVDELPMGWSVVVSNLIWGVSSGPLARGRKSASNSAEPSEPSPA